MEKNFRYIKKNGNFILENDRFKIEYSKPLLKGKEEFSSIKKTEDIDTSTYILKIFKSLNNRKWKLLNSKQVNGLGIFELQTLIHEMIHKKKIACQKSIDENGNSSFSYLLNNSDSASDDFYEMKKFWNVDGEISFSLYVGILVNESNSDGIYFNNLNYEDVLILKKCINEFVSYAIMIQNQKVRTYNKFHSKCYHLKDGRIYYFDIENSKRMKNIYVEKEDVFDVTEINFIDKETFNTKFYPNVTIDKITKKDILLSNGVKIKSGRIQDIKRYLDEEDDKRFQFGANGVANDFIYALSVEDRDDFSNLSRKDLIEKYGEVILNRTDVGSERHSVADDLETFQNKVIDKIILKLFPNKK